MELGQEKLTLLNGKVLDKSSLPVVFENTAFSWGMSVFTTGLINNGQLPFYEAHERRLREASQWLFGWDECPSLREILKPLAPFSKKLPGHLRIRVSLFENMDGQVQQLLQLSPFSKEVVKGLKCESVLCPVLSSSRPNFVKLGSYAETFRLKKMMTSEPLFYDNDGFFMEGAIANVVFFDEKNKAWVTPSSRFSIVEGLGLKVGLKSLPIECKPLKFNKLEDYSAAFFVNSLRGLTPIISIDKYELEESNEYFEQLQSQFVSNSLNTGRELWSMEK